MRRYIELGLKFGIYLVFQYPKILWYRIFMKKIPYEKRYDYVRKLTRKLNQRLKIEYSVEGLENIPQHNNIVFLPNHQSLFDTVLLLSQMEHRATYIAKKEVYRMPIIGLLAKLIEVLLLDREDARSALKTLKLAAGKLAQDRNIVVFLEGTRTRNKERQLGVYKNGGIRPAYITKATLVPIVLDRSWEVFDKTIKKKKYVVDLAYLPAITYEEYSQLSYAELANNIRELVNNKLQQIRLNKQD